VKVTKTATMALAMALFSFAVSQFAIGNQWVGGVAAAFAVLSIAAYEELQIRQIPIDAETAQALSTQLGESLKQAAAGADEKSGADAKSKSKSK
jgi:hypothetical protein